VTEAKGRKETRNMPGFPLAIPVGFTQTIRSFGGTGATSPGRPPVLWVSSDPNVATVDPGPSMDTRVTGVGPGRALITATFGGLTASIEVVVYAIKELAIGL
jgi:uncharacterized protein YjdB